MSKSRLSKNRKYLLKKSEVPPEVMAPPPPPPADKPSVDLRDKFPQAYDQGQIGSCSANAIAGVVHYHLGKQEGTPSRLFIYYNERAAAGDEMSDCGSSLFTGLLATERNGIAPESLWTYEPADHLFAKPDAYLYDLAKNCTVSGYRQLADMNAAKSVLCAGRPVILAIGIYPEFESSKTAKTGILSMPTSGEEMMGGHAVVAVGYDDSKNCFIVRNSWGTSWGLQGYFMMPYEYAMNQHCVWEFWDLGDVKNSI